MRDTGLLVLFSCALILAVILVAGGLGQPRPALDRVIRHLRRSAPPVAPSDRIEFTARLGVAALTSPALRRATTWRQPLRLIGRTVPTHLGMLILASLAGAFLPVFALAVLHLSGVVSIGVFVPAGVALVGALLAPLALHGDSLSRADDVRVDLRHQLSAYLDMVTMLLAGNTGHEGALQQAARAGDGMLFRELRRRMREVGTTGRSLVDALSLVADDLGIVELEQVAAAARLSAAEGAPVARTLAAKCSTLRSTLSAEQETDARVRNDKVTPPLVGMALLFMALIIYPALNI